MMAMPMTMIGTETHEPVSTPRLAPFLVMPK